MEGKDSFILYTKYINTFKFLTDEQAGKLIKHIFRYVNDLIPEEQEDELEEQVLQIAWINIKTDLKEDLVKWKNTCETNKQNGLKGGRPRKQAENKKTEKTERLSKETEKTERLFEKPKKADNEYEYDYEYDNEVSKDTNNIELSISKDISNSLAEVSKNQPQPFITLPCLSNYNHQIFKEDIEHYKQLYPACNVEQELRNMLGWLESNPQNKKTKNGIKSFIARWLSKAQNYSKKVSVEEVDKTNTNKYGGFTVL